MQRVVGTALVVVLVILSGCSGVFGGDSGEPRETLTPASVPTDEPTPTPAPQLAPGLNQQGIENASALITAHSSFLQNRSFTQKSNTTELAPNGTLRFRSTTILRAGPPDTGEYGVYDIEEDDSKYPTNQSYPVHIEFWENDKQVFRQLMLTNETRRYEQQRVPTRLGAGVPNLRYTLESFNTANTSVIERARNGTTLYLVRGNTEGNQESVQGNLRIQLLVDSQGVIHRYQVIRQLSARDSPRIVTKGEFSNIGTTDAPRRPSWVDKAMNQTTPVSEN